jgi:hypothetical protein
LRQQVAIRSEAIGKPVVDKSAQTHWNHANHGGPSPDSTPPFGFSDSILVVVRRLEKEIGRDCVRLYFNNCDPRPDELLSC